MSVVGIVPAAGAGERLGADVPKAFAVLGGKPMLEWSLDVLREVCDRVVVAVPPDRAAPPDFVAGGATRSESVRNALAAAPEASIVVVHDAALVEAIGGSVCVVESPRENLKVTTALDVRVAEMLLAD